jgi:hypothetical protein
MDEWWMNIERNFMILCGLLARCSFGEYLLG